MEAKEATGDGDSSLVLCLVSATAEGAKVLVSIAVVGGSSPSMKDCILIKEAGARPTPGM